MERNKTIRSNDGRTACQVCMHRTASHVHHYATHVYHTYIPLYSSSEVGCQAFFITPLVEILAREFSNCLSEAPWEPLLFCVYFSSSVLSSDPTVIYSLCKHILKYLVEFISDAIRIRRNLCVCERRFLNLKLQIIFL